MKKSFYVRYSRYILLLMLATLPVWFYGASQALRGGANDVREWLPRGFEETRQYDWFLANFGSEEMAVVSWPGCTPEDERLEQLAAALQPYTVEAATVEAAGGSSAEAGKPAYFQRVLTGSQLLDQLTGEPLELSRSEAMERLRGTLFGPQQQTGLVVMVSPLGAENRHAALETVTRLAEREAGISSSQLRLGGPTVDSVALDQESARSRYRLAAISVLFALALAWRCLRRVQLVAMVFATALISALISVALVHYTGNQMSLVLVTMPTLIYVLALSGAIHLTNYYVDALRAGEDEDAPRRAVAAGWWPCTLTAGTTAIGLGSLGLSEVIPVKLFGIYSALGVLCSLAVLLLFLPAMLQAWPLRSVPPEAAPLRRRWFRRHSAAPEQHWSWGVSGLVTRFHAGVFVGSLLLMALVGVGLSKLQTSVKLLNLFSPDARIIQDYSWLEENLGPLVPVEVVVRIDDHNPLSMLQRVELVRGIEQKLDQIAHVGGTMSAATFAPEMPAGGGVRQIVQRRLAAKKLEHHRQQLIDGNYLRDVEGGQLWRISARVEALNTVDYGQFIDQMRSQVQPVLDEYDGSTDSIDAVYTGVVPLVYKAQRALLNDLTRSFLMAFLLIGGVMVVMLRGVMGGVLVMLPNVFPALLIFGAMGWSGKLLDIGSMMTASVALGIAVDDTIHFLSWFRRGLRDGLGRWEAIQLAYQRCAGAMVQTTIICGLGLLVFGFSSFVPTSHFAVLMFAMLVAALVGDLLFLPSMLAGPLGRFFCAQPASSSRRNWSPGWGRRSVPAMALSSESHTGA